MNKQKAEPGYFHCRTPTDTLVSDIRGVGFLERKVHGFKATKAEHVDNRVEIYGAGAGYEAKITLFNDEIGRMDVTVEVEGQNAGVVADLGFAISNHYKRLQ